MRKVVVGTLVAIILVGGALLIERSIRLNRTVPVTESSDGADAPGNVLPIDLSISRFPSQDKIKLESFKGKVVLINFWASWCTACISEMPSIQKLYDLYKDRGFEVIAINVDDNPAKVVPRMIDKLKITFPVYTEHDGELTKKFEVSAIPFSIVAGRDLKVVWSESGERDWSSQEIRQEIEKLLK